MDEVTVIMNGKGGGDFIDDKKSPQLADGQCCFWQHFDYQNPSTYQLLLNDYKLDQTIVDALTDDETRPRYFTTEKGFVIILRGINRNIDDDIDDMLSLRIYVDDKKIITLSHRNVQAINFVLDKLKKNKGPKNTSECFMMIADYLASDISDFAEEIGDKTNDLEEKVIDMDNLSDFGLRAELSALRRQIISVRRYTYPQKEIFQNLHHNESTFFKTIKSKADLREIYNTLTKSVEDLDYSRDHLSISHEELQSKMSINMSRIMYMISIVTVIFMPLGLIAGLLGINVAGIPYAEKDWAFAGVCLLLILIGGTLLTIMKKLRWL